MDTQKRLDEAEGGQPSGAGWAFLGGASREKADAFLDRQAELARLQAKELRDELHVRHWRARVEHWSGLLKLAFEVTVAILALAILIVVGAAVWNAAHDNALVIEAFSVPPDLAARGLNGQTVAAHLQDKLLAMQNATQSARPADSYSNDWGDDIKVQIPETGVSIGEVHRLLVGWLGHQTHISGDVMRANGGALVITTRTGSDGTSAVTGNESELERLLQDTAEAIYLRTQPYRYAVYLGGVGRHDRERAIYQSLLASSSPRERAWAYVGLSNVDSDVARSLQESHLAAATLPGFALPWQNMAGGEASMGHEEDAVAHTAVAIRLMPTDREISPELRAVQLPLLRGEHAFLSNDYTEALRQDNIAATLPVPANIAETIRQQSLLAKAFMHDAHGVSASTEALPQPKDASVLLSRKAILLLTRYALDDWAVVATARERLEGELVKDATASGLGAETLQSALDRQVRPYFAIALAMHGELAAARAEIEGTPLDCDICLRARGRIAAREHRWDAATYWYDMAVRHAPSIALGYSDWGAMLLQKGDFNGAIAKFAIAHQKSPHFADPLEMWGEALIAQNRSDLALAKFAEAAQYAPNWGRLHLKWGEALLWLGRKDEAQKQFAIAAKLDLAEADRHNLARLSGNGA